MIRLSLALILAIAGLPALAADPATETVTPGNALTAPPAAWLGELPHFVLMGTAGGYRFDVQYPNVADAAGIAEFQAKREYVPNDGGYGYKDFEFALKAEIDGVEKAIEIELETADFTGATLPASFPLAAGVVESGEAVVFEIEFEWEIGSTAVNEEIGDWQGTLTLVKDAGSPDDKGLSGDGVIAGFVEATRGGDHLVASFTVPVADYEIDD